MSVYTSIRAMPVNDEEWQPEWRFLEDLAQQLGVPRIEHLKGYARPRFWELAEEENEVVSDYIVHVRDSSLFHKEDISLSQAIALLAKRQPVAAFVMFPYTGWAKKVAAEAQAALSDVAVDGFVPWDTSCMIGPWSECAYDELRTLAKGRFYLSISGDGCPTSDPDQYAHRFAAVKAVRELTIWLETTTKRPWRWITCMS